MRTGHRWHGQTKRPGAADTQLVTHGLAAPQCYLAPDLVHCSDDHAPGPGGGRLQWADPVYAAAAIAAARAGSTFALGKVTTKYLHFAAGKMRPLTALHCFPGAFSQRDRRRRLLVMLLSIIY